MRGSFSLRRIAPAVALALLAFTRPALAEEDKFQASATFIQTYDKGAEFELSLIGDAKPGGEFTATAYGKSVASGKHQFGTIVMDFGGGDTLTVYVDTRYDPVTDRQVGTYEVIDGTGRLEEATGSGKLIAAPAGDGTGTIEMDGTLSL